METDFNNVCKQFGESLSNFADGLEVKLDELSSNMNADEKKELGKRLEDLNAGNMHEQIKKMKKASSDINEKLKDL